MGDMREQGVIIWSGLCSRISDDLSRTRRITIRRERRRENDQVHTNREIDSLKQKGLASDRTDS